MTTITIPKEISKKYDLIIMPRKEYEKLLGLTKKIKMSIKKIKK